MTTTNRKKKRDTVLVIPDTQVPFDHPDAIPFLRAVKREWEPNRVVQIGDLVDHHALSQYYSDPDGMSAGDELKATIKSLRQYYRLFPKVDVLMGNHDERVQIKAFNNGIPLGYLRPLNEVLKFPEGWKLHEEKIEIDGVIYEHGHYLGGGSGKAAFDNAFQNNMQDTVFGHFHSEAGVKYRANRRHLAFAMNVGCLMDSQSYAAAYGKRFKNKPILAAGIIDRGLPTVVPMILDRQGRWIGKI